MTLSGTEFTRRFLLHFLPERFVKIRHHGLLGNRDRVARLAAVRVAFGVVAVAPVPPDCTDPPTPAEPAPPPWPCPHCGSLRRELLRVVQPGARFDSS